MAGNFILDEQPFHIDLVRALAITNLLRVALFFFFFQFFCPVNFYVGYLQ